MTHLRRFIEEHKVLYPDQLAEALRRQRIYGGSLDTILLELELVDHGALDELLERACGFPVVPLDMIQDAHERPETSVPDDMLNPRGVEPLGREGKELIVAVHPDLPDEQLGRLLRKVELLRPMVTPECCMEKLVASRQQSVVPQRYAVLYAAHATSIGRRSSVAGSYDGVPVPFASERRLSNPAPTAPADSVPDDDEPPADSPDVAPAPTEAASEAPSDAASSVPSDAPARSAPSPSDASSPGETSAAPHERPPGERPHAEPSALDADAPSETADLPRRAAEHATDPALPLPDEPEATSEDDPTDEVLRPVAGSIDVDEPAPVSLPASGDGPEQPAPGDLGSDSPGEPGEPNDDDDDDDLDAQGRESFTRSGTLITPADAPVSPPNDETGDDAASADHSAPIDTSGETEAGASPLAAGAQARDEADVQRRLERAHRELRQARSRDAALQTLVDAAMILSMRVGLFRVRGDELVGFSTPRSALPELGGEVVSASEGSAARVALNDGRYDGSALDADLRLATGATVTTPCALQRVDIKGRPVVVIYLDRGGVALDPLDLEGLAELARVAGGAFEEIVKIRRRTDPSPVAEEVPSERPSGNPGSPRVLTTPPVAARPPGTTDGASIPTPLASGTATERIATPVVGGVPPSTEVGPDASPASSSTRDTQEIARAGDAAAEPEPDAPQRLSRDTQELVSGPSKTSADSEPTAVALIDLSEPAPDSEGDARPTVYSSPPPPPLPPPPRSAVDDDDPSAPAPEPGRKGRRSPTIHGLPPPEVEGKSAAIERTSPRGEGSAVLEGDDVVIIPLAEPIMPTTARGRIELEDEDWVGPGPTSTHNSQQEVIDEVIEAVMTGNANVEQLRELGRPARLRLVEQFPGPLEVLRRDLRSLPPPSAHGPLIRTVISVGEPIVPHIIDLLAHPNPDVRFYAAFVFHELRDPRCMRPLASMAFDINGDVRVVAMRVLETYRRAEGFEEASAVVREHLGTETRTERLHATRAAGTLRDTGAVPELIELLTADDRFIQEAALESLCSITGQQHGLKPHRWRTWYDEQGHRHRVEWIIDSLKHRDLPVRRWAADELVRITGHRVPFSPMGDRRSREIAAKAWSDWWEERGRAMFGG